MNVFIVTGEKSGDIHAANLMKEMLKMQPDVKMYGTGGRMLKTIGQEQFVEIEKLESIGVLEALKNFRRLTQIGHDLLKKYKEIQPDLLILVDYPGFNLRFMAKAKKLSPNTKIVYYIPPQVWIWKYNRIYTIKQYADLVIPVLPFEEEIYKNEDIPVSYYGHPIIDNVTYQYGGAAEFNYAISNNKGKKIIGLFPGSRKKEIERNIEIYNQLYEYLERDYVFVVASVDISYQKYFTALDKHIKVLHGSTYDIIKYSDMIICCSGTVTLEVALLRKPMIIHYDMGLTLYVGLFITKLKMIGLPNIILNKKIMPELINSNFNIDNILKSMSYIERYKKHILKDLDELISMFPEKHPSHSIAKRILELFGITIQDTANNEEAIFASISHKTQQSKPING